MSESESIHVKNMVCNRCIVAVDRIFQQAGVDARVLNLGEVKVIGEVNVDQLKVLDGLLLEQGFERIDDKKGLILEQIKAAVIDSIHHRDHFEMHINWSHYLSEKLGYDYNYLSNLFSSVTGITLEQYIIKQKIEKVKEYLFYDELSVKEIAFKMGYSSVAHLSSQFKKVTGQTPTAFKESRETDRKPLDSII